MSDQFYNILQEIIAHKQMSISSIARELKKAGFDQHRLILTGYLRALHDMGFLEETDIPPSKVYLFKNKTKRDIYSIIRENLQKFDQSERPDIAVYLLTSLFHRPCFKCELELLGIEIQKTKTIKESKDSSLKEHRASVTRIKIPVDDPAFEISSNESLGLRTNEILLDMIHNLIDLEGIKAKSLQTKLA